MYHLQSVHFPKGDISLICQSRYSFLMCNRAVFIYCYVNGSTVYFFLAASPFWSNSTMSKTLPAVPDSLDSESMTLIKENSVGSTRK